MDDRFIKEVRIDWNKIERDSYLREIASLKDVNTLCFKNNITFFVGENGSGKSTLLVESRCTSSLMVKVFWH